MSFQQLCFSQKEFDAAITTGEMCVWKKCPENKFGRTVKETYERIGESSKFEVSVIKKWQQFNSSDQVQKFVDIERSSQEK